MIKEMDINRLLSEYINKMPSLPTSVTKVLEICNNQHTNPIDLNHVISLDPVLVGRVLKLINSAYYGLGQHVTNLARAIIMLGINTVKNLALSTVVLEHLASKSEKTGLDMEGFWRHSLCVGVSAKLLARKRGIDGQLTEEYFTAGILHDIGKIPLNAVLAKDYMLTISVADKNRESLFRTENSSMGLTHCDAGAMIASAWKLQGAILDVIVNHHNCEEYSGDNADVVYTVAAANHFASLSKTGFSGDCYPESLPKRIWEALDVPRDVFDDIEESVHSEIEKAAIYLKLNHL